MSLTATSLAMIAVVVASLTGTFLLANDAIAATPKPASSSYGHESPSPARTRMRPASPSAAASSLPVTGAPTGLFAITGLASLITGAALLTLCRTWRIRGASPRPKVSRP